tara:strand:+ start:34511 stop:35824 length:1314 start_codon:yes stop_codon:yes gene_type:complete
MKISKLKINKFRHLENLDFDFTYPSDYKDKSKAGKPLDKICFIGQSASGKTSLLELIYEYGFNALNQETVGGELSSSRSFIKTLDGHVEFLVNDKTFIHENNKILYNNKVYEYKNSGGVVHDLIPKNEKEDIIYFKADLISENNIELFAKNPLDLIEKFNPEFEKIKEDFKRKKSYDSSDKNLLFDSNVNPEIWLFLLTDILDYRKKFTQKMSEFINKGLLANQKRLSTEFNKWQKENPNPLKSFSEKLNPVLEKLNLEVDIVDTEYTIPLRNKITDEIIPIHGASTGTKGLLLSFLPLFKLNTKDSLILIDEPERSLFPDMQMDLMEHYQNLTEDSQFIVATHSPFIAASFEPEERFILYFDDKGKVQVRRGESPIGDDPNDMLKNDFKVNYYNKYGENAYKQYLRLKQEVANEKDSEKKRSLMLDMVKLGDKYNF